MASQVAEGYILVSANTLRGYTVADLTNLRQELEKLLREARAVVPPQDDALANQARNRKIGRISSAVQLVSAKMTTRP